MAHIFGEILKWSKNLEPWQNEAIRRLFQNGELSQVDKDAIFNFAKIEYGLLPKPAVSAGLMLKPTEIPTPPKSGNKIFLKSIRELNNVNALKNNQRVLIGEKVTIIYGDNGVGKSGYARVTKRACRARAVDPILPNVYTNLPPQSPSAIFEIKENGVVKDEKWIEEKVSPKCLGRFAVFDSKCGRVYVSEDNELGVLPYGFDIIKGVSVITDEIKKRFSEIATLPDQTPLKLLLDQTSIGKTISTLSVDTKESAIKSLADWNPEYDAQLKAKGIELSGLKAKSPQAIRDGLAAEKKRLQAVITVLTTASSTASEEKLSDIVRKVGEVSKFQQAVAAAAKLAFGEMNLPGIGGDAWRELFLAAANFSTKEAYVGQAFPTISPDSKCVLCLQPVNDEIRARLKGFWDFIQNDISSKLEESRDALNLEIETLKKVPSDIPKEIIILEDAFLASGSKVYALLESFYKSLASRVTVIEKSIKTNVWSDIPALPVSPVEQCDNEIATIDKRLAELQNDQKITEEIQKLSVDIAELSTRKCLKENLPNVLGYLTTLKESDFAKKAAAKINTYPISAKATELQNKFITEEFKRKVFEELTQLGLPKTQPRIDKKSEKGKVLLKLAVPTVMGKVLTPESVFSEGERTAIALACFLAELSIGNDNCGIILDDPVSSFDHRIREKIAKRLVREANDRQVIIFTHDLIFYRELVAECKHQNIEYEFQSIEALGDNVGIVSSVAPWDAMKIAERQNKLNQILAQLKKAQTEGNIPIYRNLFRDFYSKLRSTWERSVEELLFNQVVQRLEKEVKTKQLGGVLVDTESVAAISEGMTKTSNMIEAHDHPVAVGSSLPSTDDISKDLLAFTEFVKKHKEKQKKCNDPS